MLRHITGTAVILLGLFAMGLWSPLTGEHHRALAFGSADEGIELPGQGTDKSDAPLVASDLVQVQTTTRTGAAHLSEIAPALAAVLVDQNQAGSGEHTTAKLAQAQELVIQMNMVSECASSTSGEGAASGVDRGVCYMPVIEGGGIGS